MEQPNQVYIVVGDLPSMTGIFLCYRNRFDAIHFAAELADAEMPQWMPTRGGMEWREGDHYVRVLIRPLL